MRAILAGAAIILVGCSSQRQPVDTASNEASPSAKAGIMAPQSGASATASVLPISDAMKPPHASVSPKPAEPGTSQSGASMSASASPSAVVTPQSGASKAARAAAVESRSSTIPMIRDVPVSGVKTAPNADALPAGVPYASDKDPVQIVSYVLSSTIIHPGDKVTGDVVTSSNAASVTAQVGTITITVPKIAPGKFHLLMQLPSIPLPPGAQKLIITAIRTDGMQTTREVPITVVQ
jgi:hypothetical protein